MSHITDPNVFKEMAQKLFHVELSTGDFEYLVDFTRYVLDVNEKFNWTGYKTEEKYLVEGVLDSLCLFQEIKSSRVRNWIDWGTGSGIPGAPNLISGAFQGKTLVFLDSNQKKVEALEKYFQSYQEVQFAAKRGEEFLAGNPFTGKDWALISKAVAPLPKFFQVISESKNWPTEAHFMKGPGWENEYEKTDPKLKGLYDEPAVKRYELPDPENSSESKTRILLTFTRK